MAHRSNRKSLKAAVGTALGALSLAILSGCGDLLYDAKLPTDRQVVKIYQKEGNVAFPEKGTGINCNASVSLFKEHFAEKNAKWHAKVVFNDKPAAEYYSPEMKNDDASFKALASSDNLFVSIDKAALAPAETSRSLFFKAIEDIEARDAAPAPAPAPAAEGAEANQADNSEAAEDDAEKKTESAPEGPQGRDFVFGETNFLEGIILQLTRGKDHKDRPIYVTGGGKGGFVADKKWQNAAGENAIKRTIKKEDGTFEKSALDKLPWPHKGVANLGDVHFLYTDDGLKALDTSQQASPASMPMDASGDTIPQRAAGLHSINIATGHTFKWLPEDLEGRTPPVAKHVRIKLQTYTGGKIDGVWMADVPSDSTEYAVTLDNFSKKAAIEGQDSIPLLAKDADKHGYLSISRRYFYNVGDCGLTTEVIDVMDAQISNKPPEKKDAS